MLVIKDFATTTIASALTAAATSIVVSDASRLPALSAGDHFDIVLQKFTDRNYVEIVRVTGVSGNTLTVARGRDGTMGRVFSIGDYAEVRLTVGVFSTYVSQLVEGKVDKDFSYVNQRLQVVNTGDLVGASLALLYAAGTGHGTVVSGGEGVNKQTPYIALRPLGHANAATQLKYTDDGALSLVGGTRSASFGFILSEHSFDSNGFPNAVNNNADNYVNRARSKITAGNSGLHFLSDAALDARRFGIQSGHSSAANATSYGILDLNPFGGLVRVNGGSVYHTGYAPTPAAVGALALSGGTLTGNFDQNFGGLGYGFRFSVSGSLVYFQGGKRDGDEADQKLRISGYLGKPLTEFNILTAGHGIALVNGARLYTEQYLPTPDVLGCVPSARTINSKPLSANIALTAADVGAVPQARTINTKPLTSNVVLSAADVGALALAGGTMLGVFTVANMKSAVKVDNQKSISYQDQGGAMFHHLAVGSAFQIATGPEGTSPLWAINQNGLTSQSGPAYAKTGVVVQSVDLTKYLAMECPESSDPYIASRGVGEGSTTVAMRFGSTIVVERPTTFNSALAAGYTTYRAWNGYGVGNVVARELAGTAGMLRAAITYPFRISGVYALDAYLGTYANGPSPGNLQHVLGFTDGGSYTPAWMFGANGYISYSSAAGSGTVGTIASQSPMTAPSFTPTSDGRLKPVELRQAIVDATSLLRKLNPQYYFKKYGIEVEKGFYEFGFIADEVEEHEPRLVFETNDAYKLKHLAVNGIVAHLSQGFKELDARLSRIEQHLFGV